MGKVLLFLVTVLAFIVFVDLKIVSCVTSVLLSLFFGLNTYKNEKTKRTAFACLTNKKESLLNWEKFIDVSCRDPIFIIDVDQSQLKHSLLNIKETNTVKRDKNKKNHVDEDSNNIKLTFLKNKTTSYQTDKRGHLTLKNTH